MGSGTKLLKQKNGQELSYRNKRMVLGQRKAERCALGKKKRKNEVVLREKE